MAFPLPRPQAPQLPQHLLRTVDCKQGAVRAVRFNGKKNKRLQVVINTSRRLNIMFHFNRQTNNIEHLDSSEAHEGHS